MWFVDMEVFLFDWMMVAVNPSDKKVVKIVNNKDELLEFYEANKNTIWVTYNGRHYDQYIIKGILCGFNPKEINDWIIVKKKAGWQFSSLLNKFPLNIYDVSIPLTRLKVLEGFMGSSIKETSVSFDIDRKLTNEEIEESLKYCEHDVFETMRVFMNKREDFDSQLGLIKMFNLPLSDMGKTKVQLAAKILDAKKIDRDDEFDLVFPDTLKLGKYEYIKDWFLNNKDYSKKLNCIIGNVPHVLAWGGIHGAKENYIEDGIFLDVDVASFYPALMIEYGFGSRNMSNPEKYREIRDLRLKYKDEGNPMANPLKIVLNGSYGAMKHEFNPLYDPRQANNVCVGGQLLIVDLIEKLENHCELVNSNTDGIFLRLYKADDYDKIINICKEWEKRTRMELEFKKYKKIIQGDVNNYIFIPEGNLLDENGRPLWKAKGGYVKHLSELDNDLPIVNKAITNYFLYGVKPEDTINVSNELKDFQKIVKITEKYENAMKDCTFTTYYDKNLRHTVTRYNNDGLALSEKVFRVFASKWQNDGAIYKHKTGSNPHKFANTPDRCFIDNDDINGKKVPTRLDRQYYIDLTYKRIKEKFGVDVL